MPVTSVNRQLATGLGLSYNRESGIVAGIYNGYHVAFIIQSNLRQIIVSISNSTGQMPKRGVLKQVHKENEKVLSNPSIQGYRVTYSISSTISDKGEFERSTAAATVPTGFLKANCLHNYNELSGRLDEGSCYYMSGDLHFLTHDEYDMEHSRAQSSFSEQNSKRGNPIAGVVGALIGSFAGLFVMVLIGQLGSVLPWTGLVIDACVAKGYEPLSGKFGTVGLVYSIFIMVGMTYFDNQLDWAITIARAYEANAFDAFPIVNEVVKVDELLPVYYHNLVLYYFAMLRGVLLTTHGLMKNWQLLNVSYPIGPGAHEPVVYVPSENGTDPE